MTEISSPKKQPFVASSIAKLAQSRFLAASLAIHVFLLVTVGTIVLFKVAQPQDGFLAVGGVVDAFPQDEPEADTSDPTTPDEFEEATEDRSDAFTPASTQASAISALMDFTPSSWSTAAPIAYQPTGQSLGPARPLTTGKGGSIGNTFKLGSTLKARGSIFGAQIEASKLGVIVDVSGSAHGFLVDAFKEIDKGFPDAVIILHNGCGLAPKLKKEDYSIVSAKEAASEFGKEDKDKNTVFGVIDLARGRDPNLDRYFGKLLKRDTTYLLATNPKILGNLGTRFAFDKLIEEGVDTIYWFADFADDLSKVECREVGATLQAKGIKLVAHNFSGNPIRPALAELAAQTGGITNVQVPKK